MSDLPLIPPLARLTYFSPDGCTVVLLPFQPSNAVTLLHNDGIELRPFIFSDADASDLASALDAGASFNFKPDQVTLKMPDGRTVPITAIPRRSALEQRSPAASASKQAPASSSENEPPDAHPTS